MFRRKDGRWVARVTRAGRRRDFFGRTRRAAVEKAQAFLEATALRPRTRADYEATARRYLGSLMGRRLSHLEALDVLEVLQPLRSRPRAALKAYRLIHRVLGFAVRCGCLGANPADRVDPPGYQTRRRAVWSEEQLRPFLPASTGWAR